MAVYIGFLPTEFKLAHIQMKGPLYMKLHNLYQQELSTNFYQSLLIFPLYLNSFKTAVLTCANILRWLSTSRII